MYLEVSFYFGFLWLKKKKTHFNTFSLQVTNARLTAQSHNMGHLIAASTVFLLRYACVHAQSCLTLCNPWTAAQVALVV